MLERQRRERPRLRRLAAAYRTLVLQGPESEAAATALAAESLSRP
jgi:hypothetical protein